MRVLLLALLTTACNPVTGPSPCHWVKQPRVEVRQASFIQGRLVFITVIAPETKTKVCDAASGSD